MGFQNIVDANGIGLAITGMTIVFVVLVLVSLFITCLPRVLPVVNAVLPPVAHHHHGAGPASRPSTPAATPAGIEDEIVAAIGVAMHRRQQAE